MPVDPITFEIIRHRLFRVVEEAVITLKNVSGSPTTNEGHDLMVSLYTADGGLLMGGVGFLHHLSSASEACKAIIRRFGARICEGDIYLLNDPYTAALHTSDVYLIAPVHHQGNLVAWSACFVHVNDITAMVLACLDAPAEKVAGETFQVGTGRETTLLELAAAIMRAGGEDVAIQHAAPSPGDVARNVSDISKAERVLGYTPRVTLETGIAGTLEWFRDNAAQ